MPNTTGSFTCALPNLNPQYFCKTLLILIFCVIYTHVYKRNKHALTHTHTQAHVQLGDVKYFTHILVIVGSGVGIYDCEKKREEFIDEQT